MAKCKDCKYEYAGSCTLRHVEVNAYTEHNCQCFNRDLSEYDMCYNCKYYGGGSDFGMFCSHEEMYNHLGKFNDEPCGYYEKKEPM